MSKVKNRCKIRDPSPRSELPAATPGAARVTTGLFIRHDKAHYSGPSTYISVYTRITEACESLSIFEEEIEPLSIPREDESGDKTDSETVLERIVEAATCFRNTCPSIILNVFKKRVPTILPLSQWRDPRPPASVLPTLTHEWPKRQLHYTIGAARPEPFYLNLSIR
ncbi:hypothetical protein EVAR_86998_1 [Eumeta japonica]|uniref:Uncharacterized protein n=1 Tax=Eumeta variegata TaxID=151549 RepID=A0A4C1W9D6_EUMVA|nr:hypothetical protein EVAR_86998_1 [Eumeta japonica]